MQALWEAHLAETGLLSSLASGEIEVLLRRIGLKSAGSKAERIRRLLEHFASAGLDSLREHEEPAPGTNS